MMISSVGNGVGFCAILEELKDHTTKLNALFSDPQPGLMSWNMAVSDQ